MTAHDDARSLRQILLRACNDLVDLRGHVAEVGAVDRAEYIDGRRGVVVAHDSGGDAAMNVGDVGEQLRGPAGAVGQRRVAEIVEGLETVLRGLGRNLVLRARRRVDPKAWRCLEAARERHQHIAGHVLFGEADQLCLGPIDIDIELRIVPGLMDMQIDRTRNAAQLLQQDIGECPVGLNVEADNLHIDGGGKTEIQNLTDHVRRQKGELRRWVGGRQFLAQ